jgi:hypothetical protein
MKEFHCSAGKAADRSSNPHSAATPYSSNRDVDQNNAEFQSGKS